MSFLTDDEIRALLDGATPGPWRVGRLESYEGETGMAFRRCYFDLKSDDVQEAHVRGDNCDANARLIAAAPSLAAEVLRLREALREAEQYLKGGNPLHASGGFRNMDLRERISAALKGAAE